ncbi:alcohol dehydrogenase catalytic domain-containing protein [Salinicola tamaricis]|uniref:alcohol dehydrogenase catalytic domain-containing protein n=1 Tax=Salinicola tamaricis TaxID=1771309 RepID=UPI002413F903|nr:alcohol dehydrogenase catalytic domain-containing protein [Salinicola tamaricis]
MSEQHMKAARWYRARDIRVEQIEVPTLGDPHQVKVKVAACGICGSDLHEYAAGPIFIPVDSPHPLSHDQAPIVMGHEFAGEVVEVGSAVTRVAVGDRVAIEPILSPHRDGAYLMERYNLSPQLGFHGLSGGGGGFAEYTVVASTWYIGCPMRSSMSRAHWSSLPRSACMRCARVRSRRATARWCSAPARSG